MISFENLTMQEGVPIYLQMILFLKRGIVAGAICDGDELPSRRAVSALLGVNPNTVQKAYRQLEEEGLIQSRAGAKSCVSVQPGQMRRLGQELLQNDVKTMIEAMKQTGITREEAIRLLNDLWEEEE